MGEATGSKKDPGLVVKLLKDLISFSIPSVHQGWCLASSLKGSQVFYCLLGIGDVSRGHVLIFLC